jgi:hypothetical protein
MPPKEICSPVNRKGSKVGSPQPLSPGARSDPSRGGRTDSVPDQPSHARVSRSEDGEGGEVTITGPKPKRLMW